MNYRADIDGLRAVAVMGVVLYHAGLGVPGGFVGVDIFFVISGFLITTLLLRDLRRGSFSIVNFWERRARRIFPALACVLLATLIAGWFLMLPFGYQVLGQSLVALTVFASNIQFWRTTGYFDPVAEENPLLHTWSLSVEEQFYLVVPLVLAGMFRFRRELWIRPAVIIGLLISLVFAIWWLPRDPAGTFYLLPSRAWELASGSLLAMVGPLQKGRLRGLCAWGGIGLIAGAFALLNAETPFPGIAAIPPVLGAALLVWSGMRSGEDESLPVVNRILTYRPFVLIGLASYSFYLWHWPFFAFHQYLYSKAPPLTVAMAYVAISFLLSLISLHFVERPFRTRRLAPTRRGIFLVSGITSALIFAFGLFGWRSRGIPSRVPPKVAALDSVADSAPVILGVYAEAPNGPLKRYGAEDAPYRVLVWGDSHATSILPVVDAACKELNYGALAATKGGTPPVLGWSGCRAGEAEHKRRIAWQSSVMQSIRRLSANGDLHQVVLAFRWSYYIDTPFKTSGVGTPPEGFEDALLTTVNELQNLGVGVVVLREVPIFEEHVAKTVALNRWRGIPLPALHVSQHQKQALYYDSTIERLLVEKNGVFLIDPLPYLQSPEGFVSFADLDGALLYRDEHHLTNRGCMRLLPEFRKVFGGTPGSP
jgi:peptidoglycan/LPS O-acetylase OafA/YrhL